MNTENKNLQIPLRVWVLRQAEVKGVGTCSTVPVKEPEGSLAALLRD